MWLKAHAPTKFTPGNACTFAAVGRAASLVWATTPIQTATAIAMTPRHRRMGETLRRGVSGIRSGLFGDCDDRLPPGLELLGRQPDVGVPPEAAREDTGSLDWWCLAETRKGHERADRDAPAPAFPRRIVLGIAVDLDDREDVLPSGRVANREVALLQARASRG